LKIRRLVEEAVVSEAKPVHDRLLVPKNQEEVLGSIW
jgi:hypothetical protein